MAAERPFDLPQGFYRNTRACDNAVSKIRVAGFPPFPLRFLS